MARHVLPPTVHEVCTCQTGMTACACAVSSAAHMAGLGGQACPHLPQAHGQAEVAFQLLTATLQFQAPTQNVPAFFGGGMPHLLFGQHQSLLLQLQLELHHVLLDLLVDCSTPKHGTHAHTSGRTTRCAQLSTAGQDSKLQGSAAHAHA